MSKTTALDIALAYHEAWAGHDFERAMTYIHDEIVCNAPAGTFEGAEAFRGYMGPFVSIMLNSPVIAAFGDENTALIMYDTETTPVADAPGAECITLRDGKIVEMRLIFDRAPFDAARAG